MQSIGIDAGSTATKGVLLQDEKIVQQELLPTAGNPVQAMTTILQKFHVATNTKVITTGYGRKLITADRALTEITCHARGAKYLYSPANQLIDIGGQDSKVISMDENGGVQDFIMNDKCAAGTGRFVESLMGSLNMNLETLDQALVAAEPIKINSMCTVFAESEVVSLVGSGKQKEDIALGVLHSIAKRIASQFQQLHTIQGTVFFSGGLARSQQMQHLLQQYLQREVVSDELAPFTGAIGAALYGIEMN